MSCAEVKVDRPGAQVRERSWILRGQVCRTFWRKADREATGSSRAWEPEAGDISGFGCGAVFLYFAGNGARQSRLDIPGKSIKFDKDQRQIPRVLNIWESPSRPMVRWRPASAIPLNWISKEAAGDFASRPYHYENQFYIASGQYTLKIAVNSGDKYGKFEMPLVVDHYDPKKFSMSGLALSKEFHKVSDMSRTWMPSCCRTARLWSRRDCK